MKKRKNTRVVKIGALAIGGENPIAIQSMTNTDTRNAAATIAQINDLAAAGCEIVRVAVPDDTAARAVADIKKGINIPLVADIHFDYQLALTAIENGVDKLRINPGNIGSEKGIREIVAMATERNVPIRIGVNAGSLEKEILAKNGGQATPDGMVASAQRHIQILEDAGFDNIVVSMKASDVCFTIASYEQFAELHDYPLHLGITEAGILRSSAVKSAMGIGYLLLNDASSSHGLMRAVGTKIGPDAELALVAWKEQNLLMADRPARTFGFKRDFALQLADARRWQAEALATRWILLHDIALDDCIDETRAIDMGIYNRRRWLLLPAAAMRVGCVPKPASTPQAELAE